MFSYAPLAPKAMGKLSIQTTTWSIKQAYGRKRRSAKTGLYKIKDKHRKKRKHEKFRALASVEAYASSNTQL